MSLKLSLTILSILLFSGTTFSNTNSKSKALTNPPKKLKILSFFAVKKLSSKAKREYTQAIAKTLITLNKEPKDKISLNLLNLFLMDFKEAQAAIQYLCIGGGIPIPNDSAVCGVSSYAGFSCPDGLEICNPLIFGVDKDQKPVCHITATTKWCFQNTKLGEDHFLDPVFALNNKSKWNELLTYLEEACNNPDTVAEDPIKVRTACDYSLRQMIHNQEVKNILRDYSYQNVDGYGILPAQDNSDNDALGAEVIKVLEESQTQEQDAATE